MILPQISDKFFISNEDGVMTYASINHRKGINNEMSTFYILEGYREAAILLLNQIMGEDKNWLKIDSLIYPVMFNFRHYLEMIIKDTLRYHRLINKEIFSDQVGFKKEHSIKKLWNELKPYLMETYSNQGTTEVEDAVDNLINELEIIDGGSFSFRYPFFSSNSKSNSINYSLQPMTINLINLKEVFEKLIHYFESINGHAAIILDEQQTL